MNTNGQTGVLSTANQWRVIGFIVEFLGFFVTMSGITLIFNNLLGTDNGLEYAFQMSLIGFGVLWLLKAAFPKKNADQGIAKLEELRDSLQESIDKMNSELEKGKKAKNRLNEIQSKLAPEGFTREVLSCTVDGRPKLLIVEYPDEPEFTQDRDKINSMIDNLFDDTIISTREPARKESAPTKQMDQP